MPILEKQKLAHREVIEFHQNCTFDHTKSHPISHSLKHVKLSNRSPDPVLFPLGLWASWFLSIATSCNIPLF